jgi:hypothetical protein
MDDEPQVERELVRCAACRREVEEAEAQAQRWGYWQIAVDLYPFCPACANREFDDRLSTTPRS